MPKLPFTRRYLLLRRTQDELVAEVESLRAENSRLREGLVAAQESRQVAQRQAEELRKEKERLRQKSSSIKKELERSTRMLEQLSEKVAALRQANEELAKRTGRVGE